MNRGDSSPSSKLMTVRETAPTATGSPNAFDHLRAGTSHVASPLRSASRSAMTISSGKPTPSEANTM